MYSTGLFPQTLIYEMGEEVASEQDPDEDFFQDRITEGDSDVKDYLRSMDKSFRNLLLVQITQDKKIDVQIRFKFPLYTADEQHPLLWRLRRRSRVWSS